MAALTWKNVDAPDMTAAGSLMNSANNAFSNSMDILRKASDRSRAQNRAAYSARMLQQLAGVKNADDIGSFISGFDASDLSPEAMNLVLRQGDVLQGRAIKDVELANAKGDLAWEQDDRAGQLAAAPMLAEAAKRAVAGDVDGAFAISQGLDGHALRNFNSGTGSFLNDASSRQDLDEKRYDFGEKVTKDEDQKFLTDKVDEYRRNYNDKAEARNAVINDKTLKPKHREQLLSAVDAMDDGAFNFADPNQEASFALMGDNDAAQKQNTIASDLDFIGKNIEADLQSLPSYNYKKHFDNISAIQGDRAAGKQVGDERVEGEGYFDPVSYLRDTVGITEGWRAGRVLEHINDIKADAKNKTGKDISNEEAAAAIAASSGQGGLLNRGNRVVDAKKAVDLLVQMKDPEQSAAFTGKENKIKGERDSLKKQSQNVEKYLAEAQNQLAKGQNDKAQESYAKAKEAQNALLTAISDYNEKNIAGPNIPENGTITSQPQQNGPVAPDDVIGRAIANNPNMAEAIQGITPTSLDFTSRGPETISDRSAKANIDRNNQVLMDAIENEEIKIRRKMTEDEKIQFILQNFR